MHCPTIAQTIEQVLKLLPRGRAWQMFDGLPMPGYDAGFNPDAYNNDAFATSSKEKSILYQFWRAYADVAQFFNETMCALRLEFWCATHDKTHDGWLKEYGLPDECDPFPDLCAKVAAIGGTRCEYYQEIAARMGWAIECIKQTNFCGSLAGRRSMAGRARAGSVQGRAMLKIRVFLDQSEATRGGRYILPLAGRFLAGRRHSCGPDISALQCILTRVIHAEILTVYEGVHDDEH
jgi:hypothetical protein